ncbi:spore germination protein GerPC [Bacillus sp. FJAT-52991]|uniref:Spore germination protein GerPC n=1 Tax=Bacillus kandeliae TaxID=3129297 RepID=A0ABZ2N8Q0_9BACI
MEVPPENNIVWQWIQYQQKQIESLKKTVQALQQEVVELKNRPAMSVDKIEYSFDQLKVETLAGTLNIGLNPAELGAIKDYAVDSTSSHTPKTAQQLPKLLDASREFLETHLDTMISDYEGQLQQSVDPQVKEHMKQDLFKQLPQRISFYLDQCKGEPSEKQEEIVLSKIKTDIQQALFAFISKLPKMG